MRTKLTDGYEPELFLEPEQFEEETEDGTFWDVPKRAFSVNQDNVTLRGEIAAEMEWVVQEVHGDTANVTVPAQTVELEGEEYPINPGFAGGLIHVDHLEGVAATEAEPEEGSNTDADTNTTAIETTS